MSNPTWPETLPQYFDRQGFVRKLPEQLERTPMDAGPAKQRSKARGGTTAIEGNLFCRTDQQRDDLLAFFNDTLQRGVLAFDWVDPWTREACTMRFTAEPVLSMVGQRTLALCKMEILP